MKRTIWIGLAVAAAVAGIWTGRADAGAPAADKDTRQVMAYAEAFMAEGYTFTLQHHGTADERQGTRLVKELSRLTELERKDSAADGLQETYRLGGEAGTLTLVHGAKSGKLQEVLILEGTEANKDTILELQRRLSGLLSKETQNGRWSTKVQGDWEQPAGSALTPEEAVEQTAEDMLGAERSGMYRDSGTVSMTFTSDELTQTASKRDRTALQTSLRHHSETGGWKLTVGAPMLTGEF